jgi:hypothetical protein
LAAFLIEQSICATGASLGVSVFCLCLWFATHLFQNIHALLVYWYSIDKKLETLAFINLFFLSLLPAQPAPAIVKAVRRKTTIKRVDLGSGEFPQKKSLFLDFIKKNFYFNLSVF